MQQLIYVPPGASLQSKNRIVELAAKEPFILSSVNGLGGEEANIISSDIVGSDGEFYHGRKTGPIEIGCELSVYGKTRAEMYAERMRLIGLLSLADDEHPGTLYYTNDYISVKIGAVPKKAGDFRTRKRNYNIGEVTFYCPVPRWISLEEQSVDVSSALSGFEFPCEFDGGVAFAKTSGIIEITNNGTANTPVRITVVGPSTEPSVKNLTTGKKIKLSRNLESNETLVIETERGNKSVTLIDRSNDTTADAFGYLDPLSEFWELVPGNNRILYGSDGTVETGLYISYFERYAGV